MIEDVIEDVVEEIPGLGLIKKIPGKIVDGVEYVGEKTEDLFDEIPGIERVKKVAVKGEREVKKVVVKGERAVKKVPEKIVAGVEYVGRGVKKVALAGGREVKKLGHTLLHPCSWSNPVAGLVDGLHKPKMHSPKICGTPATTIAKDIVLFPIKVGHSMIDGVKYGAKGATHLMTRMKDKMPSFDWPVDGKCPYVQKGARRTRRRKRCYGKKIP